MVEVSGACKVGIEWMKSVAPVSFYRMVEVSSACKVGIEWLKLVATIRLV